MQPMRIFIAPHAQETLLDPFQQNAHLAIWQAANAWISAQ
jgi:hypothetical protein